MEKLFCPKCKSEMKPIYKDVYRYGDQILRRNEEKGGGVEAEPTEWLCELCEKTFEIKVEEIICREEGDKI